MYELVLMVLDGSGFQLVDEMEIIVLSVILLVSEQKNINLEMCVLVR